jgi:hypothetical protein
VGLLENLGDDLLGQSTTAKSTSSQGCIVLDGDVLDDNDDLSTKIANGGVGEALLYGNAKDSEITRAVAYLLDTYAPLAKTQELWGRPIRAAVGQMSEFDANVVPTLRVLSKKLALSSTVESNKIVKSVKEARIVQANLLGTALTGSALQDKFHDSLMQLDAVSASQTYAVEQHTQDILHAHQMMTIGTRVYQDAGIGSVNTLGTAVSTNQRVNSLANAGRAYSTTAANALADRQLAKNSGRSQLFGYLAGSLLGGGNSAGGAVGGGLGGGFGTPGINGNAGGFGGGGSSSILSGIGDFIGGLF